MTARTQSGESPTQRNSRAASRRPRSVSRPACGRRVEALLSMVLLVMLLLGGCTVGPKYVRPSADAPAAYKETPGFKPAQPSDDVTKGKWWEVYGDPQLNSLEEQVSVSNQTLKAAQAQFLEARAAVRIARAAYFPTVSGAASG